MDYSSLFSTLSDEQKIELYTLAKKKYPWASDTSLKHICKVLLITKQWKPWNQKD